MKRKKVSDQVFLHQGARSADLSGQAGEFEPRKTRNRNHLWKENCRKQPLVGGERRSKKASSQKLNSHPQLVFRHLGAGGEHLKLFGLKDLKTGLDTIRILKTPT